MCIPGTGSQCTRGRTTLKSRAPAAVKMNAAAMPAAGTFDFICDEIISGCAPLWPRTAGRADQLDGAQPGSQESDGDHESGNILESIRLEPINDVPAVIIGKNALCAESKQTGNAQPGEESERTYLQ